MGHQVALELRREAHFDVEAAFRPRVRGERGVVGARDRADDGEAEPVPAGVPDSLGAESLEGLEKAIHLVGRTSQICLL